MCPVLHLFSVVFFLQIVCFGLLGPVSLFVITNRTTIFTLENPRAFGSAGTFAHPQILRPELCDHVES